MTFTITTDSGRAEYIGEGGFDDEYERYSAVTFDSIADAQAEAREYLTGWVQGRDFHILKTSRRSNWRAFEGAVDEIEQVRGQIAYNRRYFARRAS